MSHYWRDLHFALTCNSKFWQLFFFFRSTFLGVCMHFVRTLFGRLHAYSVSVEGTHTSIRDWVSQNGLLVDWVLHEVVDDFVEYLRSDMVEGVASIGLVAERDEIVKNATIGPKGKEGGGGEED